MGGCHIAAFFRVGGDYRFTLYRMLPTSEQSSSPRTPTTEMHAYIHYHCTVQSFAGPITTADIRPPTPFEGELIPEGTIIYVDGTVFIRGAQEKSLVDAAQLCVICPSPTPTTDTPLAPQRSYPAAYFNGVGSFDNRYVHVASGAWIFPVTVSQFVRDTIHTFKIG